MSISLKKAEITLRAIAMVLYFWEIIAGVFIMDFHPDDFWSYVGGGIGIIPGVISFIYEIIMIILALTISGRLARLIVDIIVKSILGGLATVASTIVIPMIGIIVYFALRSDGGSADYIAQVLAIPFALTIVYAFTWCGSAISSAYICSKLRIKAKKTAVPVANYSPSNGINIPDTHMYDTEESVTGSPSAEGVAVQNSSTN